MKRLLWLWGPPLAQMGAIFFASAIPNLKTLPGDMSDHVGHFIGYAILGLVALRACAGARWEGITYRSSWQAWTISACYGAFDEFHQRFVPGRSPAVDDWMADALGAAVMIVGIALAAAGHRVEQREV